MYIYIQIHTIYLYIYIHIYIQTYIHMYIGDLLALKNDFTVAKDGISKIEQVVNSVKSDVLVLTDSNSDHEGLFYFLCSLLIPYWMGLCVLRRTCRQDYETLFHVVILSKHHHHHVLLYILYFS
jgi:hypothetical protein